MMKKLLCVLLSAVLLTTCVLPAFAAKSAPEPSGETETRSVTIYVDGINAENIVDSETGKVLYPPTAGSIIRAILPNAPAILTSLLTRHYDRAVAPLSDTVEKIFEPALLSEDGTAAPGTRFNFAWPTEEEILEHAVSTDPGKRLRYAFDWRFDMDKTADDLHSFIEYVIECAGVDSINIVGCSMGACAVMSYLEKYDAQYIDGVFIFVGALNGTTCCGEPFAGKIALDGDTIVRYVESTLGGNFGGKLLGGLLRVMRKTGSLDRLLGKAMKLTDTIKEPLYYELFEKAFTKLPGMWALVPYEDYADAKALAGDSLNGRTLATSDWYHEQVQNRTADILRECADRGIKTGIIAKYGFPNIPCVESAGAMTDNIIDTRLESFGAVCADFGSSLGDDYVQAVDNGHDCISPDRIIDSSTCTFCDRTWFIKNSGHADSYDVCVPIVEGVFNSETPFTVWNGEYSQFLEIKDGTLVPLQNTAE